MGDAIMALPLLNTLRHNFPEAQIDFVLNERVAPLFMDHPSIDRIITFTPEECHSSFAYIRKVWHTVHEKHYDVIIDMRSTLNTMLFPLFSPCTRYRIGIDKGYTKLAYNRCLKPINGEQCIVDYNTRYALQLQEMKDVEPVYDFSLAVTDEEKQQAKASLTAEGVDLSQPIMLANVTAKLASKEWMADRMVWVLQRFMEQYPHCQIIFNYASEEEEVKARRIYALLGSPQQVFVNVQARTPRELVAMTGFMTFYFGNEGGTRHIAHAVNIPSFAICAPENSRKEWIPQNGILAEGIAPIDTLKAHQLSEEAYRGMSRQEQYELMTKEMVWDKLQGFLKRLWNEE